MSIALKYTGGMIVSKEYEVGSLMDTINKVFTDTFTVNNPFVIGEKPIKGQEINVLVEGKKVYLCVLISEFTNNKIRLSKGKEINFIKEQWQQKILKQE